MTDRYTLSFSGKYWLVTDTQTGYVLGIYDNYKPAFDWLCFLRS